MPEEKMANEIANGFPGTATPQLVEMAVSGYQGGQGARICTFAVLLELDRRGASDSFNRVRSILTPDDNLFFGSLLKAAAT